jgi:hypothetical protein
LDRDEYSAQASQAHILDLRRRCCIDLDERKIELRVQPRVVVKFPKNSGWQECSSAGLAEPGGSGEQPGMAHWKT